MATATQAAAHICLSVSRFRDLIGTVFERQPSGRYDLDVIRENYCRYAQKVMQGRTDDGGKALSQRRGRLAEAQTQAVELKTAILSGEYVRLSSVVHVVEEQYAVVRERVLSTPGKAARNSVMYSGMARSRWASAPQAPLKSWSAYTASSLGRPVASVSPG